VDSVFHTEEIVVKPMSTMLRHIGLFSGNTILGDGSVILIVDPNGLAQAVGTTARASSQLGEEAGTEAAETKQSTSMLVFRAGSPHPRAVPLSLITRLEEIDVNRMEFSNGRYVVQYRGQLMPLIPINDAMQVKSHGQQSLLVFSDEGRSMGLMVDEIVDIVDDTLNIEVRGNRPGVLGSAVIKGQATEIIDIEHYLPLAFEDWFRSKDFYEKRISRTVLLVDDSAFFRNMLAPVLKAAGYDVTTAAGGEEAMAMFQKGRRFDVVLTDIDMPGMDGFVFAEQLRSDPRTAGIPIIGISSMVSQEFVQRGREVGFHDYVAKFDRQGLISALKEQTAEAQAA
jgi:two-component system chemotaxis sensor kinase CheA